MDLADDREDNIMEEEEEGVDRISNLPDDIIHHILSLLDMKYAVQTSALSRKWRHIWTSAHGLTLDSCTFRTLPEFAKFVKHALPRRSNVEVSKVQFTFTGSSTPYVVKSIVHYVYLHNVRELNITWVTKKFHQFPQSLFSSGTLKHLTLTTRPQSFYRYDKSCIPKVSWDFPALETVVLSGMHFGDKGDESVDFFSKCVSLKDLTLDICSMYGLNVFIIYAPELSKLRITEATSYPNVFNVVAPRLESLTASVRATINRYPVQFDSLQLSTQDFGALEKVNLSFSMPPKEQKRFVPLLFKLFAKLRNTKSLVISLGIIQVLSLCPDQLSQEPCPFNNLKSLNITIDFMNRDKHKAVPIQVRNYLLENSPSATVTVDLPQVSRKRAREEHIFELTLAKLADSINWKPRKKQPHEMLPPRLKNYLTDIRIQSDVLDALKFPPASRPSSSFGDQTPTSSSNVGSGSNSVVQP